MSYYNPMDEGYEKDIYTSSVGASVNPMEHQTEALKARIFQGVSVAELGSFMGTGKGNKQAFTPESFGSVERRDMRDLAEINKVETSVHAAPGAGPLSGFSREGFNDEQRAQTLKEIKKAIDFAAEASTGGPIVFHTGEWQRPISESFGKKGFKGYPEEADEAPIILADDRTGDFQVIKKDQKFYVPVEIDHIIDTRGNKVPIYKTNPDGSVYVEEKTFNDVVKEERKKFPEKTKNMPDEQIVLDAFFRRELEEAKGLASYYSVDVSEQKKTLKKVIDALKFYKELKQKMPEKDWWKVQHTPQERSPFIPADVLDPIEYLEKSRNDIEQNIRSRQELAMSYGQRAKQTESRMEHLKPAEEVGIKKTADTIANAALFAMEKTKQHRKELKEDLFVAPESYDPKQFGSHPEEIRKIVEESRKAMVSKLKGPHYKMSEHEAEKYAKSHIKATMDIGHFNTWRQFFERKDGESIDQADKRFNKWVIDQTKKLAKDGIIGHIHLSDNFGYDDEHITPGQGNAPIKEFVEEMKKAGLNKFIVEAGSFNPLTTLPETWAFLGSPVYSISRAGVTSDTWTNVHRSYFGKTSAPYYVVGDYSPSEDFKGAPWWSGTPME